MPHRPNLLARGLALSLIAVLGVAQAAAPAPEVPEEWPAWLKKEIGAEKRKRRKTREMTAGQFKLEAFGKLADTQDVEGTTYFAIDIGTTVPVSCWVYAQPQYMATTVQLITDSLLEQNGEANGTEVKQRLVYYNDAGALDDMPYLANEWLWVIEVDGESSIGLLKLRAAQKENTLFLCAHDQVGYRDTFAEVFAQVVRSATWPHEYSAPYAREILTYSVAGRPAGLAWSEFRLDQDGDTVARVQTSMALQVDDSTLSTTDSVEVEFSRPNGELINAYSESAQNAEINTALSLNTNEAGNWVVTGRLQGKEVDFDLGSEARPLSVLGEAQTVSAVLGDTSRDSASMTGWVPDADPSTFITADFKVDERGSERSAATYTIGPIALSGEFENATGSMINGSMAVGGLAMRIDRVFSEGELP